MPKPKHLSFTLRVDVPFTKPDKTAALSNEDADEFRFLLDLNPDSFIFEADSNTQISRITPLFDQISEYLNYVLGLCKKRGLDPTKIVKIAYKRNSPALANVHFMSAVNGDIQPPSKPTKPG